MSLTLERSLAFFLGFSFAFLPNYGPFFAILFFIQSRVFPARLVWLWLGSALLFSLPLASHSLANAGLSILQIAAPFLVYLAFSQLPRLNLFVANARATTWGLFAGFGLIVISGLFKIANINFAYKSLSQAVVWQDHPALYGHTVLTLGILVALLSQSIRLRLLALAVSASGILLSGSREAAIAWVIFVLVLFLQSDYSWRKRALGFLAAAAILVLSVGLGPRLGWGNVGFLLDIVPGSQGKNLVQGSELPSGDWWDTSFTSYETYPVTISGQALTAYQVTKDGSAQWLRLQQVIPIERAKVYTASVWIQDAEGQRPGIQGWSKTADDQEFILSAQLSSGVWYASVSGQGRVVDASIAEKQGDWTRVFVSFIYDGDTPKLYLYLGLTPDQQEAFASTTSFAGFQLEQSALTSYAPGAASRGLSLGVARIPYWSVAWQGIAEKPWLGHGLGAFPDFYQAHTDQQSQLQAIPAHTHNLFLQTLFERGFLGFAGLLLFVWALAWQAMRQRDGLLLTVIAVLLLVNSFDISLFYGAVLYPLAAAAGWRSSLHQGMRVDTRGQQLFVRMCLGFVDYILLYFLLSITLWTIYPENYTLLQLPQSLSLALLIWPAMAWREGLYPGYGLSAAQELKKQVYSSFYASLIIAAGTLLFESLQVAGFVLLIVVLASFVVLPLGRFFTKLLLLSLGLWGKPVVILGAGTLGKRVAQAMLNHPLNGLNPMAVFDDDPRVQDDIVSGLAVLGTFAEVELFSYENGIDHAIVTVDPRKESLPNFHRGSSITTVQFIPELTGIPSEGVYASSVDGLLALEVKLGLRLPLNRTIKRTIDIILSLLMILVFSPLLLLLYLLVRLDSRGPAFYPGERMGQHDKIFRCLKFRTMYLDADKKLESILSTNPALREEYETYHKLEHDPRITRVGKWLRKLSLDELPQLFNVLLGEMSLIGPRPYLVAERSDVGTFAETIFAAKPGITGYWQTSGRNSVSFQQRLEMEAYYVQNWSIWWDIIILVSTPEAVLKRRGH